MNKFEELQVEVDIWKPNIFGITETWCDESVPDSKIHLNDYTLFTEDKKSGVIGGVILCIHNDLQAVRCREMNDDTLESAIWCNVKLNSEDTLFVGVCYRSPNSPHDENNEKLFDQMRKIDSMKATHILVVGDFNFKEIDWETMQVNAGEKHPASTFFDLTQDVFLFQHVTFPTRHREGQKSSLLDLVLTNEEFMVEKLPRCGAYRKKRPCWNGVDLRVQLGDKYLR